MQVLNIFGDGQNCQNQTFKWLYQLNELKYEKSFFWKILTVILSHMYQVFSSLLCHLHFSLHFFSTFMEQLFLNHPIPVRLWSFSKNLDELCPKCWELFMRSCVAFKAMLLSSSSVAVFSFSISPAQHFLIPIEHIFFSNFSNLSLNIFFASSYFLLKASVISCFFLLKASFICWIQSKPHLFWV